MRGPQIIIAGAPGVGKGTQCDFIKQQYGVIHLSTGDILRAAVNEGTELGNKAKEYMEAGDLVPDDLIIAIVVTRLQQGDCVEEGWLLDGFPRTKSQAEALKEAGIQADKFLLLEAPDQLIIDRVVYRRTDPATGKIYNLKTNPPGPEVDGSKLIQRSDDTEDTIRVRLQKFKDNCDEILGCYQDILVRIDGAEEPSTVFKKIQDAMETVQV